MSWIFIHVDRTPNLSTLIELQFLSTEYVLDIYQLDMFWIFIHVDMTPNLSTLIELQILFPRICLGYLSTEYVLDIYSC
jgi:hypothetical protein